MATDITKCKLPAWDGNQPEFWFRLADLQFALYKPEVATETAKAALATTVIPIEILQ